MRVQGLVAKLYKCYVRFVICKGYRFSPGPVKIVSRFWYHTGMEAYQSFQALDKKEKEGIDFRIEKHVRNGNAVVLAIHGGRIEPGTTEIARAIAGTEFSFYSFIGEKPGSNRPLHIPSTRFDEPECVGLVEDHPVVISIHGQHDRSQSFVMLGGLDKKLRRRIGQAIRSNGFSVVSPDRGLRGEDPRNICNRGLSGKGVQIEISRKLRDTLMADRQLMNAFAAAVRRVCDEGCTRGAAFCGSVEA